jgi:homoserine kinase
VAISVRVPASSANLGPGFDVLAIALDLHAIVGLVGEPAPDRAQNVDEFHPATIAYRRMGGAGAIWVRSPIPAGRGMGFSGAMRAGGAALAVVEQSVGDPAVLEAARPDVLAVAADLEGHADNAAASVYGGVVVATADHVARLPLAIEPAVVLWVPRARTMTSSSRAALPAQVDLSDAVFNVGRAALLVAALATGDTQALRRATEDRLHQTARFQRAPQSRAALEAGLQAGAWCGWLSGSGPTVAFLGAPDDAAAIAAALPGGGRARVVGIDHTGVMPI